MGPEEVILNAEVAPGDPGDLPGSRERKGEAPFTHLPLRRLVLGESGPLENPAGFCPSGGETQETQLCA